MAMIHHSDKNYEEASSVAAEHGRNHLNGLIEKGRAQGQRVLSELSEMVINDYDCRTRGLRFAFQDDKGLSVVGNKRTFGVGSHAQRQILQEIKLPADYFSRLSQTDWGKELAEVTLNKHFENAPADDRRILRTVKDTVKGVVSPAYQPRDTALLIESFLGACKEFDAQPYESRIGESKFFIRVILPKVFEPVKNEPCSFVIHFAESEFGNGATVVSSSLLRLACTNLAVFDNSLREVHLGGGRGNGTIKWEKDTIRAMTQSTAKQLRDVVRSQFSPEGVNKVLDVVKLADATKIDPWQIKDFLKKHCSVAEAKGITEAFNSGDVTMMPAGQTRYRFSNAISFFAQDTSVSGERSEELQALAGKAMRVKEAA